MKMATQKKHRPLFDQLKALFFGVEKVPNENLFKDPEITFNSNLTHSIVVQTAKGPKIVKSCSKGYGLMSNEELMSPIIERLEGKYNVEAKVTQFNHSKFYTDFIIKDKEIPIIKKDMIFPRIRMNNSYDGSVKYQFSFGFYRLVCENGMTAPVTGMQSNNIKLRHTPGNSVGAMDKTMKAIEVFLEQAPEIAKGYQDLAKTKLNWEKAMELVEKVLEETKFPKKAKDEAIARLTLEHGTMDLPLSEYLVYNALNYALYKSSSNMKTHKKDRIDMQVLKYISNQEK
jgi:hypothetical protein